MNTFQIGKVESLALQESNPLFLQENSIEYVPHKSGQASARVALSPQGSGEDLSKAEKQRRLEFQGNRSLHNSDERQPSITRIAREDSKTINEATQDFSVLKERQQSAKGALMFVKGSNQQSGIIEQEATQPPRELANASRSHSARNSKEELRPNLNENSKTEGQQSMHVLATQKMTHS